MPQNNVVEVVRDTTSPGCYSHLFLVPKKSGGWRPLISQLLPRDSSLHDGECGKYSAISPSRCLGHFHRSCGCLFPHTHPQRITDNFFDFRLGTEFTNSGERPFGLSPAPWVFTKIMTEIKILVHVMGINLCQYLDDWLIYSPIYDQCFRDTVQVLNLCHTMGPLIHDKKLELIPKQKFLFLGYQFDLVPFQPSSRSFQLWIHITKSKPLIPAKPRRTCSYMADPTRSLCVHRKTGSSGMAIHPRSPTLHLSTLGF